MTTLQQIDLNASYEKANDNRPIDLPRDHIHQRPTKAAKITSWLVKTYGLIVAQVVTAFIRTFPTCTYQVDVDDGLLLWSPPHPRFIKEIGLSSKLYWRAIKDALEAKLLIRKIIDGKHLYAINFMDIDKSVEDDYSEMERARANREVEALRDKLVNIAGLDKPDGGN